MNPMAGDLLRAIEKALGDDWEGAHGIAQTHEGDRLADWLHAILHKIEGDGANSRYWYARAGRAYEDWADAKGELEALRKELDGSAD